MRVVSKFNPEKKFYEYKHRMELHDDFGDEGRLCFDEDMYQIKKYMALFVLNPNTPKKNIHIKPLQLPNEFFEDIDFSKMSGFKKIIYNPNVIKVNSFHLQKFITALSNTDIDFLYESKSYLDEQAVKEQHKPLMFKPIYKPKK